MNQILATNNDENNKKDKKSIKQEKNFSNNNSFDFNTLNSYSNNDSYGKTGNSKDFRKIVIIFAIAIAIFGVVLIGVYANKVMKEKKASKVVVAKPEVLIEENGDKANLLVSSAGGLNKVRYYWDKNDIKEVNVNSGTKYEVAIDIPNGENILYIEATDIQGQTTEVNKKFSRDGDVAEPQITTEDIGEGKVVITAIDETSMDYVKYKWTDGEEEKIKVENEGDQTIEVIADVPRGENKLYITAVDTSGNETTEEQRVTGVLKPTIDVKKGGKKLRITVSHDKGFKRIEIYVNGEITIYNEDSEDYDETKTTMEYTFELKEGKNKVVILAESLEEANGQYSYNVYKGSTTYTEATN